MATYILITPEIEYSESTVRNIGKSFVAQAIASKLQEQMKSVLVVGESKEDSDFTLHQIVPNILTHSLIMGKTYDYVILAGLTEEVEDAFRILRTQWYPTNTKTIKLQSFS